MAVRTKPVRIFEADHQPLRLIAETQGCKPADVMHKALFEYIGNHRNELTEVFDETREAIANGDLDKLAELASRGIDDEVEATMARLERY